MRRKNVTGLTSAIFLVLMSTFFLTPPLNAESANLDSTGFSFTLPNGPRFPTVTGDNEIGVFSVPIPPDLFPATGDRGGLVATNVTLTFTVRDGDTAPGDIDEGDLVLTLGISGTPDFITLDSLVLAGFPDEETATAANSLDLTTDPETGEALASFISRSEGLLTFYITDLDEAGNFLDFRGIDTGTFELSITLIGPPKGRHTLTARVFVDYRCNTFFKQGVDRPLEGASVTLAFPNGSNMTQRTRRNGFAFFYGFDGSRGVVVSVQLPERYRAYPLISCPNSPDIRTIEADDFGTFRSRYEHFGATLRIDRE